MTALTIAGLAAGLYCIVRGITYLRRRWYVWGGLCIILGGALLLTTPIETHAIKFDLPRSAS